MSPQGTDRGRRTDSPTMAIHPTVPDTHPILAVPRVRIVAAVGLLIAVVASGCATSRTGQPPVGTGQPAAGSRDCVEGYDPATDYFPAKVQADHSTQWEVDDHRHYKVLRVTAGPGGHGAVENVTTRTYVLHQCGTPEPELGGELTGAQLVTVPITRAVDEAGLMAASFEALNPDLLTGMGDAKILSDSPQWGAAFPSLAGRIGNGSLEDIGRSATLNLERLIEMRPQLMFVSTADPSA